MAQAASAVLLLWAGLLLDCPQPARFAIINLGKYKRSRASRLACPAHAQVDTWSEESRLLPLVEGPQACITTGPYLAVQNAKELRTQT